MNSLIEHHNVNQFVKKITLEWPGSIERYCFKTDQLVFVYMSKGICSDRFAAELMPKAGMFVDFSMPVMLIFMDNEGEGATKVCFNGDWSKNGG